MFEVSSVASDTRNVNLTVTGLDCAECARTLELGVAAMEGVRRAEVNFTLARLTLDFDPRETDEQAVFARVRELGYDVQGPEREQRDFWATVRQHQNEMLAGVAGVLIVLAFGLRLAGVPDVVSHILNTVATVELAEMCQEMGVRRYVFASSCSIYDRGVGNDMGDVVQDETTPVDPRAAYSGSKRAAEKALLGMVGDEFCPVILRKGTVYGFSHRMRYDLVVNTFIKDALSKGHITMFYGGEMWRPLVDVRDAARAYIAALQADEEIVKGEIFSVSFQNMRISELALRVREALSGLGIDIDVRAEYGYRGVRSYRVSAQKIQRVLNFQPQVGIEASVQNIVEQIGRFGYHDFDNPRYYNIRWMRMLEEAADIIRITGSVFEAPPRPQQVEGAA